MVSTQRDVAEFVRENDVKFIRLLEKAFKYGVAFDASAVRGFLGIDRSDLFLKPDPTTMSVVPWRSLGGVVIRMICDICHPDGTPFEGSGRHILSKVKQRAAAMGYTADFGAECEFYLFREREDGSAEPLDRGGYFDVFPKDRGENVRREICGTLEQMGLRPERSHHEHGPGQNEIDFRYDGVSETADNIVTFRWVVASVARNNGLVASFEPKPVPGESGRTPRRSSPVYSTAAPRCARSPLRARRRTRGWGRARRRATSLGRGATARSWCACRMRSARASA